MAIPLMIVLVIDKIRVFSDKGKGHPPIAANRYGPCAFSLAL
jgi:hypothetical protein